MFKNTFAVLFVSLVICLLTISGFAIGNTDLDERTEANSVQPMWTEISQFTNAFEIESSGRAIANTVLYAFDVDEIRINAALQQLKNGNWTTIKSWTSSSIDIYCILDEAWYVVGGYSYRYVSTGTVYENDSPVEQTTYTSEVWNY